MNKNELISKVAQETGEKQTKTAEIITAALKVITETFKKGEQVTLVGFGTFAPKKREARLGRNPRTGEAMEIPAQTALTFKASKPLKEALN